MPEELWTEDCNIVQEAVTKTIPKKNKCKKATWLSEEALQTVGKRRGAESNGEREMAKHFPPLLDEDMANYSSILAARIPGTV